MRERQHINVDEADEETLNRMFDVKGQERRMDIADGTLESATVFCMICDEAAVNDDTGKAWFAFLERR